MKTANINQWIDEQIELIENDFRYKAPEATTESNAPLALIQHAMWEKLRLLKEIRGIVYERDRLNSVINERDNSKLSIKDYQDAITVQSASNLSGVVKSFARVIEKISNEGFNEHKGTDWVNTHPICRLYAEQICHLTGGGTPSNSNSYHNAYKHIEQRIKKYEKNRYDLFDNPKEAIEVLCHTSTRNADTIMYTIEDIRYPHFNGKKIQRRLINGEYTYKWVGK